MHTRRAGRARAPWVSFGLLAGLLATLVGCADDEAAGGTGPSSVVRGPVDDALGEALRRGAGPPPPQAAESPWIAPETPRAAGSSRVVVLGMDGLEWRMVERLVAEGQLPHFAKLLADGVTADLHVPPPIMSPVLWTTMASGYGPETHGIGGWTNGRGRPTTGADVRAERIWDVLSARGEASVVSGWLMTWPASPIPGALLSERFVWSYPMNKDADEAVLDTPETWATTAPDALAPYAERLRPDAVWLAAHPLGYQVAAYGAPFHPFPRDETHLRVFEALWPRVDARFGAVYLNIADQVSHLYWPFSDPDVQAALRADPTARQRALEALATKKSGHAGSKLPYAGPLDAVQLGEAARWVPDVYAWLDASLGRVRATVGADTTLLVVSDHGFQASSSQPLVHGGHRDIAFFAAVGPRVRDAARGARAAFGVEDVAPTIYALLDVPAAADMPGRARSDLFDVAELPRVPTRALARVAIEAPSGAEDDLADRQLREQLEALGYIDDQGRPVMDVGASRREK